MRLKHEELHSMVTAIVRGADATTATFHGNILWLLSQYELSFPKTHTKIQISPIHYMPQQQKHRGICFCLFLADRRARPLQVVSMQEPALTVQSCLVWWRQSRSDSDDLYLQAAERNVVECKLRPSGYIILLQYGCDCIIMHRSCSSSEKRLLSKNINIFCKTASQF